MFVTGSSGITNQLIEFCHQKWKAKSLDTCWQLKKCKMLLFYFSQKKKKYTHKSWIYAVNVFLKY